MELIDYRGASNTVSMEPTAGESEARGRWGQFRQWCYDHPTSATVSFISTVLGAILGIPLGVLGIIGNYGYLPGQPRTPPIPPAGLYPPPNLPPTLTIDPSDCDRLAASPDDLSLDRRAVVDHIRDPDIAVKACDAALAIPANRNTSQLYFQRGRAFETIGENEKAELDYEKARKLGYPSAKVKFAMAVLVSRATDTVQKKAAVVELRELESRSAQARYFIGAAECSGVYDKYGIHKDKEAARSDIEVAAALGVWDAKSDRCN